MSKSHQKVAQGRSFNLPSNEEYFEESPEEQERLDSEYAKLSELCDRQRIHLKMEESHSVSGEPKKKKRVQDKQKQTSKMEESRNSSQQYEPSNESDYQEEEDDSLESEKQNRQTLKNLALLFNQYEDSFSDMSERNDKIKAIAESLGLSTDFVKEKAFEHFRRKKRGVLPPSRNEQQNQTLYKKTEMFDDAVRKVLKTTPYACINDLRLEIKNKLNLDLPKQTLIRRLKNLKYHYVKFTLQKPQSPQDDVKAQKIRKAFLKVFNEMKANSVPILFYGTVHMALDECKGSMWMKKKQNGKTDHVLYQRDILTITLILSTQRVEFYKVYRGFYNRDIFIDSINSFLFGLKEDERKGIARAYLAIQSNLVHYDKNHLLPDIVSVLKNNRIFAVPFPTNSSSLNPSEVLFNQIKYVARGKAKKNDIGELQEVVNLVFREHVDLQDIRFAFRKVQQIYQRYSS